MNKQVFAKAREPVNKSVDVTTLARPFDRSGRIKKITTSEVDAVSRMAGSAGEKPEIQHLHKTREYRLPLIIYDILRNGETPGRRRRKNSIRRTRWTSPETISIH